MFWKVLTEAEEAKFRAWAEDNWSYGKVADPTWHPVVRLRWAELDREHMNRHKIG